MLRRMPTDQCGIDAFADPADARQARIDGRAAAVCSGADTVAVMIGGTR